MYLYSEWECIYIFICNFYWKREFVSECCDSLWSEDGWGRKGISEKSPALASRDLPWNLPGGARSSCQILNNYRTQWNTKHVGITFRNWVEQSNVLGSVTWHLIKTKLIRKLNGTTLFPSVRLVSLGWENCRVEEILHNIYCIENLTKVCVFWREIVHNIAWQQLTQRFSHFLSTSWISSCCQGQFAAAQQKTPGWPRLERRGAWKQQQLLLHLPLPLPEASERRRQDPAHHHPHPWLGDLSHHRRPHHRQPGSCLNQLGWQV